MTDKESDIYSIGYWNGIAYKRQRELTDEEIINLCVKELEKLIAPVEPDYDPSQWNDAIERAICTILYVKLKLKEASEK